VVVAIGDGTGFSSAYGSNPDFILYAAEDANSIAMEEAFTDSIKGQGDLSKAGEAVAIYKWYGNSDLICDCDYVLWGDKSNYVDKTGVSIDGIDTDDVPSDYSNDTPVANQRPISDAAHGNGESFNRCDETEGQETKSGDHTGCDPDLHDETSEDLENTWETLTPPTPGHAPNCNSTDND
jgi:hypothetical protein